MSKYVQMIMVIALAVFLGQLLAKQLKNPQTNSEAVAEVKQSTTGDPVMDFLNNF